MTPDKEKFIRNMAAIEPEEETHRLDNQMLRDCLAEIDRLRAGLNAFATVLDNEGLRGSAQLARDLAAGWKP